MRVRSVQHITRSIIGACALVVAAVTTAAAQDYRAAVFGHAGGANIGHADSEQGTAATFGGGASFHLTRTLLVDADVQTGRLTQVFGRQDHDFTQTTFTASLLYRSSPNARAHFLGGGGIAWMRAHTAYNEPPFQPVDRAETVTLWHGRAGVEVDLSRRVMLRTEGVFSMGGGLDWIVGGRFGVGYRF